MGDMINDKKQLAVFDLDRTIISTDSSSSIIKSGYRKGLISTWKFIYAFLIMIGHKSHIFSSRFAINTISKWLCCKTVNEIDLLIEEIYSNDLIHRIYNSARNEIQKHKDEGHGLIILSSALNSVCRHFAQELNFDSILATNLEAANGILTGYTQGDFCHGEEKLVRLKEYCKQNLIELKDVIFYSDSSDDLPTLSAVGIPVCVNPDKKLKSAAKSNNWIIKRWN